MTSEQYQCVSFREDVDNWIRRILADCSPRVGVILQQFQEVISDMCSEDIQLQNIEKPSICKRAALKETATWKRCFTF